MSALISFILGILLRVVNMLFQLFSNLIGDLFGMKGENTLDFFFEVFPAANSAYGVIIQLSYGLLYIIVLYQLYKSMWGPMSEGEDPKMIMVRGFFAALMVSLSKQFVLVIFKIATIPYEAFAGDSLTFQGFPALEMSLSDAVSSGAIVGGAAAAGGAGVIAIAISFITFTLLISLFGAYVSLVFEIVERYVILAVLSLFAPMAMAAFTSKSTSSATTGWLKVMISQGLLMTMSVFFLRIFHDGMANIGGSGEHNIVVQILMLIAWLHTGTKIDQHLSSIGMSAAQAGGFGQMLAGSAITARRVAVPAAANLANQIKGSPTSFRSMGDAMRGSVKATKRGRDNANVQYDRLTGNKTGYGKSTGQFLKENLKDKLNIGSNNIPPSVVDDLMKDKRNPNVKDKDRIIAASTEAKLQNAGVMTGGVKDANLENNRIVGTTEDGTKFEISDTPPTDGSAFREIKNEDGTSSYLVADGSSADTMIGGTQLGIDNMDAQTVNALNPDAIEMREVNDDVASFVMEHDENGNYVEATDGNILEASEFIDSEGNLADGAKMVNADGVEDVNGSYIMSSDGKMVEMNSDGGIDALSPELAENGQGTHVMGVNGEMIASNGEVKNGSVQASIDGVDVEIAKDSLMSRGINFNADDKIINDAGHEVSLSDDNISKDGSLIRYNSKGEAGTSSDHKYLERVEDGEGGYRAIKESSIESSLGKDGSVVSKKAAGLVELTGTTGHINHKDKSYSAPMDNNAYSKGPNGTYQVDNSGGNMIKVKDDNSPTGHRFVEAKVTNENGAGISRFSRHTVAVNYDKASDLGITNRSGGVSQTFTQTNDMSRARYIETTTTTEGGERRKIEVAQGEITPKGVKLYSKSSTGEAVPDSKGKWFKGSDGQLYEHNATKPRFFEVGHSVGGIPTGHDGSVKLDISSVKRSASDPSVLHANIGGVETTLINLNTHQLPKHISPDNVAIINPGNGIRYAAYTSGPVLAQTNDPQRMKQEFNRLQGFSSSMTMKYDESKLKEQFVSDISRIPDNAYLYKINEAGQEVGLNAEEVKRFKEHSGPISPDSNLGKVRYRTYEGNVVERQDTLTGSGRFKMKQPTMRRYKGIRNVGGGVSIAEHHGIDNSGYKTVEVIAGIGQTSIANQKSSLRSTIHTDSKTGHKVAVQRYKIDPKRPNVLIGKDGVEVSLDDIKRPPRINKKKSGINKDI